MTEKDSIEKFSGYLDVRIHTYDTKEREVLEDFSFLSSTYGEIVVPKGFKTDFASIPALLRPLFKPDYFAYAATIHDYLYRSLRLPRKHCDQIWLEACLDTDRGKPLSYVTYYALRAFGWHAYWFKDNKL